MAVAVLVRNLRIDAKRRSNDHTILLIYIIIYIIYNIYIIYHYITNSDRSRQVMEMLRSIRGDKHEFCLAVIKLKHVRSCPSIDITHT